MTRSTCFLVVVLAMLLTTHADAYAFVAKTTALPRSSSSSSARLFSWSNTPVFSRSTARSSSIARLQMMDDAFLQGAGIAVAGLLTGIGLVAFTEQQGERAKERGSGLSDSMSTRITGGLMEDVEVSSVSDLGSLTAQLEQALKQSAADKAEVQETIQSMELTEEEKKKKTEEADDGW
ncbi:hypothetical protein ACA910_005675 [Epithemia clementina (nom. ined.)]